MESEFNKPQTNQNKISLKIQLPSTIDTFDDVQLEIIGFKFDPNLRLISTKQPQIFSKSSIGTIINKIKIQAGKSLSIYQDKDWKNLQRSLQNMGFEIQIMVRVIKINNPSIDIKDIVGGNKSIYKIFQIDIQKISENNLVNLINKQSEMLSKLDQNREKMIQEVNLSFAPQKLYNPHIFIKTVTKDKHIQYYTKGIYEYYHYGDQNFNDHGWGCAYRSLQTLLSWFNLQNYLKLSKMLTITEIQDLIDRINLGNKDKIKNTRQWIGATEVSWVVKRLTNFDCRILHINDGKKIIEECEMIREHFEKVGTPIMYGGGEYAYSIVGINYAWSLGECEFLILDPHYTGGDSIDKILQKKGLCWRKPDQMFKKGVFYNFCLPII